ncbi:MAG TPA: hypothetical protein DEF45_05205, partial [Rhodopirellula sp.]|nr:hypothetical protein [Rhodopirellula sp.]
PSLARAVPVSGPMVSVLGVLRILVLPMPTDRISVSVFLHPINEVREEFSQGMSDNSPMVSLGERDSIVGSVVIFQTQTGKGRGPRVTRCNVAQVKVVQV